MGRDHTDWAMSLSRCKPTDAIIQRLCAGGPAGSAWRELRTLSLQGCCRKRIGPNAVGLSDAALASLAAGCPKLERVELSDLKTKESFSVEALLELANACPLKELVMERCSDVKLRHPSDAASRTVGPPFAWAINSILMRRGAHLRQLSVVSKIHPYRGPPRGVRSDLVRCRVHTPCVFLRFRAILPATFAPTLSPPRHRLPRPRTA